MRYEISDNVRHESYEVGGAVVRFEFAAGVVDASDEDAALIEKYLVPAGLAAPAAEPDDEDNENDNSDADADAPSE